MLSSLTVEYHTIISLGTLMDMETWCTTVFEDNDVLAANRSQSLAWIIYK